MSNAGQAVLSIGGAAIGFVFGGPAGAAWGFQLGGLAGSALFPTDLGTVNGPRLNDLSVQSSAVGAPIPLVYGTYAVSGNVIWSSGIIESVSRRRQGGKGGPTQTVREYSYSVNVAVGLCEGPIGGISRIWADAKLIYDARPQLVGESDADYLTRTIASAEALAGIQVYLGTADQLPDPTIESFEGVGNVSAFRDLAYVVFTDFQLADYGNRIPNFRFEVSIGAIAGIQIFTESGVWQRPAPSGVLTVTAIGGGGGGGSGALGNAGNSFTSGGQGGGGGGISIINLSLASLDATEAVTVGAGGAGGAGVSGTTDLAGNAGSDGGASAFGSHVTAGGGGGGAGGFTGAYGSLNENNGGTGTTDNGGCGLMNTVGSPPYYDGYPSQPNGLNGLGAGGGGGGGMWQYATETQWDGLDGTASPDLLIPGGAGGHTDANDNSGVTSGASAANQTTYTAGAGGGGGGLGGYRGPQQPDAHGAPGGSGGNYGGGGGGGGGALQFGAPASSSGSGGSGAGGVVIASYAEGGSGCITLGEIVSDLCLRAGLPDDRIDVSDLTECVDGYAIGTVMSARDAIQPLRSYGWFDCVESDGVLKWPTRGKALVASLTADDLGAHEAGGQRPSAIQVTRAQEIELPRRLRVHYAQVDMNYEQGEQSASRLSVGTDQVQDVELAIAMGDNRAAQTAEVLLYDAWISRNRYETILDQSFLALEPADAIEAPVDGRMERLRIVDTDYSLPGLIRLALVRDDDGVYESYAIGAPAAYSGTTGSNISVPGTADLVLLDLPLLRDADNDAGYYAAVQATGSTSFGGAVLYRSPDGGTTYDSVATFTLEATIGELTDALPAGPTTIIDEGNELLVDGLATDALESISETSLLAGLNAAAIGADGRWEVIQFRDAELVGSPPAWRLTGLLRGRRGTEWAIGLSQAGDRFVLLDSAIARVPLNVSAIGAERLHKPVLAGTSLEATTAVAFTGRGVALEPFAGVHVEGTRDPGDLTITWTRRDRLGQELPANTDIPMSEASESYEVDILSTDSPPDVLRTLTATSPSVTYTEAQQAEDFGSPVPDAVTVRIYQLSATVGRGYAVEATV